MSPTDTCAFCKTSDEDEITGELQKTPGGRIVAHYNCMLYSPKVLSGDSQEDTGFEFNVETVLLEIGRGKNLPCNFCKKRGATVGCDVESCRKTYHYPCVQKAKGSPNPDTYVIYCAWHKSENTAHGSKDIGGKTKKRMARSSANQTLNWKDCPEIGDGCKRRTSIRSSGKCIGHTDVFYLSPEGEQFRSKKKLQRHLGNFKDKTRSAAKRNDKAGDAPSGRSDVTDSATGSDNCEIEKAPETQIAMSVRVNLSRVSAEKEHCPGEQPASPQGALSTQLNGVPQMSSQQLEDSRRGSLRSGKAARKRKHLTCKNCSVPLPDAYEGSLCRNCSQKESGVLSTQLNAVPQMSGQQFEDSRRCSLRSGKAASKRKHLTCKNCNVLLPNSYEDMLCRNCLQKESAKKSTIQWNSCQDQYCKKLNYQLKSHDVPPKKRPYILQDQTLTDLRVNTNSLDDPEEEEGEGGDCDASQIDHPAADIPSAVGTYSPLVTPEDTSEPATSSMAPLSALAGTHHSHGVAPAPGPDNDSQALENLNRSTHVDTEENFLQSLAPYLHKLPSTRRLRLQEAIIVILQSAMSQNDP